MEPTDNIRSNFAAPDAQSNRTGATALRCPNSYCGAPASPGQKFCIKCGNPLPDDDKSQLDAQARKLTGAAGLRCPNPYCGAPASPGQKFCIKCGNPLPDDDKSQLNAQARSTTPFGSPALIQAVQPPSPVAERIPSSVTTYGVAQGSAAAAPALAEVREEPPRIAFSAMPAQTDSETPAGTAPSTTTSGSRNRIVMVAGIVIAVIMVAALTYHFVGRKASVAPAPSEAPPSAANVASPSSEAPPPAAASADTALSPKRSSAPKAQSSPAPPLPVGKVTSFRFFDEGSIALPTAQRMYFNFFPKTSHVICWQVFLEYPAAQTDQITLPVRAVLKGPNGAVLEDSIANVRVEAGSSNASHWSKLTPKKDGWKVGRHSVELSVQGKRIATGSFTITQ